ncbi:uncharacterized protein LOC111047539 isoform X2 [Nilaparvata lugens]|uniref:uncharacterized protein LOC111047539 isoform X2 n=1 Tax=Nilaparvata lugens TaxID=108931 RepID=UPI00193D22C0|nr:uncharacterized protein LOC111047539 isoform X2 [Nilaparvata lugens]
MGGGLPLLVIDSPTNENAASGLLCTPCPSPSPRNKSPVTVQEWVDSLPLTPVEPTRPDDEHSEPTTALPATLNEADDILTLGAEAGLLCAGPASTPFPAVQVTTCREPSEAGSHCSSVESLLEARRADPEEVLLGLGFGGPAYTADTGRIPARFLQPSKLKGVAIDDFLRHQQDLVHNFESGYWGYRGLTGPSHTIPSVIVAKIMEKLREHERENSVASPPPQQPPHFPHHRATHTPSTHHHNNSNNDSDNNKFSRVAHNLLTKIRCGSVLTPDNRAWLDSQGDKSPELARRRRLILGQQSFTFGRDGHLIESPPSSLTDSDRWTSSTGTTGQNKTSIEQPSKEVKVIFPSIEEDLIDREPSPGVEDNIDHRLQMMDDIDHRLQIIDHRDQMMDDIDHRHQMMDDIDHRHQMMDDIDHRLQMIDHRDQIIDNIDNRQHMIDNSVSALIVDNNYEPKLSATSSFELSEDNEKQCLVSMGDSGLPSSGRSSRGLDELESPMGAESPMNRIPEEDQCRSVCQGRSVSPTQGRSVSPTQGRSVCQGRSVSPSQCRSVSTSQRSSRSDVLEGCYTVPPEEMIQSLDKVIESLERIIEPLEAGSRLVLSPDDTRCKEQYCDLKQLTEQMRASGMEVDCGSEAQFVALTPHERCALQCRVVRHALSAYHAQLASDDMHTQLKTCLGVEVQKLADLLDSTSDCDRLATIVRQMTSLLDHQTQLGRQLRGVGEEPLSCHELCEVVMRRVRSLELLVRRNAQQLAEIRKRSTS